MGEQNKKTRSVSLQSGTLQSRATDFGAGNPLTETGDDK